MKKNFFTQFFKLINWAVLKFPSEISALALFFPFLKKYNKKSAQSRKTMFANIGIGTALLIFLSLSSTTLNASTDVPAIQTANLPEILVIEFGGANPATIGWTFTLGSDITVTSLGLYDSGEDGLANAHDIGIWNNSGTLLTSTTIPSGTSATLNAGYRYVSITPVVLSAGQTYVVGAFYPVGSGDKFIYNSSQTYASPITFGQSRQTALFGSPPSSLSFPGLHASLDQGLFGPNFLCSFDDPCDDSDEDEICDEDDNCPNDANPDQTDTDNDGIGDDCDACPLAVDGLENFGNDNPCKCDLGYFQQTEERNGQTVIIGCQVCPVGKFCPDGISANLCPVGRYQNLTGQTECKECNPGTFSDFEGAASCTLCSSGTFQPASGSTECLTCCEGTNSSEGVTSCDPGEWGEWSECSEPCGGGTRNRTRPITQYENGQVTCTTEEESEACNTQPCQDSDCDGVPDEDDVCPNGDDSVDANDDGIPDCSQLLAYDDYHADWKCANNKINICKNDTTLCINKNALPAHFNNGHSVGPCTSCGGQNLIGQSGNGLYAAAGRQDRISIFPNPANYEVYVIFERLSSIATLRIMDMFGRTVFEKEMEEGVDRLSIDLNNGQFENGMYLISLSEEGETTTKQLVILQ